MEMRQAAHLKTELMGKAIAVGKYFFIGEIIDGLSPETLRKLTSELRSESPVLLISLAVISEGKPFCRYGIGDEAGCEKGLDYSKSLRNWLHPKSKAGRAGKKRWLLPVDRMPVIWRLLLKP